MRHVAEMPDGPRKYPQGRQGDVGGLQLQRSPVCTPATSRRAKPAVAIAKAYLEVAPRRSPAAKINAKFQMGAPAAGGEREEVRYMRKPWRRESLSLENASGRRA
jgi:hypothetical protein